MRTDWRTVPLLLAWLATMVAGGGAQEPDTAEEENGWSNATELSVVRAGGNADPDNRRRQRRLPPNRA